MYKTRLQELCQQRRWDLPKYNSMKDGPDHMPSFKASVWVNSLTFTSPASFSSSKEAQNQAAMLAFNTLTSAPPGSSTPAGECDDKKEQIVAKKPRDAQPMADTSVVINDLDHHSKSQLQNYARRNNLDPPVFSRKVEGPPHAPRVKATVIVDEQSFESPAFFKSIKEAEQAAAKLALTSLSVDIFETDDSSPFKIILQELTQRKSFGKPTYKTIRSGPPHMPTFFSTVEIEGKEFDGKACKSKKLAEQDAAKVAYLAMKESGLNANGAFSSSHNSDIVKSKQNLKDEDEPEKPDLGQILAANVKVSNNEKYNASFPQPPEEDLISNKSSSYNEPLSNSSPKSSPFSQLDLPCASVPGSSNNKTPKISNSLLCNRFKVYTSFPNIAFPEGITVMPIADNKWVAMSMEFPNE